MTADLRFDPDPGRRSDRSAPGPARFLTGRRALVTALAAVAGAALTVVGVVAPAGAATLLKEDFSASLTGWTTVKGTWNASNGQVHQTNSQANPARLLAGATTWRDYTITSRIRLTARIVIQPGGRVELQTVARGKVTVVGATTVTKPVGTWHTLGLTVSGTTLRGTVDGTTVATVTATMPTAGKIGLVAALSTADFDEVLVTDAAGVTPTKTTPAATTKAPTTPATVSPTPTTTTKPTAATEVWNPPTALADPLDTTWNHMASTYPDLSGFKNYIWDQIIAGKGTLNYCVRWESTQKVTPAQRDQTEVALQRHMDHWVTAMTENGAGWNSFPYTSVKVNVVGWAVKDRSLLQWNDGDDAADSYVNQLDEGGVAQCAPPCGRFFHQDNDYSGAPRGSRTTTTCRSGSPRAWAAVPAVTGVSGSTASTS